MYLRLTKQLLCKISLLAKNFGITCARLSTCDKQNLWNAKGEPQEKEEDFFEPMTLPLYVQSYTEV